MMKSAIITLFVLLLIVVCFTTAQVYKIEVKAGENQSIKASSKMKRVSVQVLADNVPLKNATVYFYSQSTSRVKIAFKPNVVQTDDVGWAHADAISGFVVGEGSFYVSLYPRNTVNPTNPTPLSVKFVVQPRVYAHAWAQIAVALVLSLVSVVGSFLLAQHILRKDGGTAAMRNVSDPIKEGAQGFLKTQYITISIIAVPLSILLFIMYYFREKSRNDPDVHQSVVAVIMAVSFLIGAFLSGLSGFIGMFVSVRANVRVTSAATRSYNEALSVATQSGAFAGFLVVSMSVLGVCVLFAILYAAMPQNRVDPQQIVSMIVGFSFGCSLSALFAQLGGGIFTKAADVGADLVGKVESNIPEDDIRNPAVIADLVGDNVGDCAGRGSDLFESISAENIGVMILAGSLSANSYPQLSNPISYIIFPLMVHVCGMIGAWVGIFFVRVRDVHEITANKKEDQYSLLAHEDAQSADELSIEDPSSRNELKLTDLDDPMSALNVGFAVSTAITLVLFVAVCYWSLHDSEHTKAWWHFTLCGILGMATSWAFVFITVYYTDYNWYPVRSIAEASKTGAATNVISGIAVGLESTCLPIIVISFSILVSYYMGEASGIKNEDGEYIGGLFGIAVATIGMLSSSSFILTMDTLGPIVDNAGGIAEMSGASRDIRLITDRLDAVGNTTKALTKGYAIGSAALAAFLLFTAYLDTITAYIGVPFSIVNLATPEVFVGCIIGAMLVFLFSSLTIRAVGNSAQTVIMEVRRQFAERPGIMDYTARPDYERCVAIVTRSALLQMIAPGLLSVIVPVLVGFLFRGIGAWNNKPYLGAEVSAGFLMVATIAGVLMALFLNNAGGAWDNAKKYCELDQSLGGKGSDVHKATVIGDTVGDPFKDTAGPSLHILIKLLATITLVLGPMYINQIKSS
jgi:Na+/H+-translocating membrane pyrophosphatase